MPGPAPRRVGAGRTARAAAEVWALTVLVHTAAGGGLPSVPWLVAVAGLVALATAWVLRRSVRPALMLPVLVLGQLGLHAVLAGLSPAGRPQVGHGHPHHSASTSPWWMDEVSTRMVVAHVLCALLTSVVWWVRRSVVDVVLTLASGFALGTLRHPKPGAGGPAWPGGVRFWLVGDPGRAPPRLTVPA